MVGEFRPNQGRDLSQAVSILHLGVGSCAIASGLGSVCHNITYMSVSK